MFLKSMFLGMLAIIHYPSQLVTFLLILRALQPCKIPYSSDIYIYFFHKHSDSLMS